MPIARHKKYSVNVECDIVADPPAVFDALTHHTQRWDYYAIEFQGTDSGNTVILRDGDGNAFTERVLAYQAGKLFARTEQRFTDSGEPFQTQVYFYLTKTAAGTRIHVEQSGYDDMMTCEQDKLAWNDTLANLKALFEESANDGAE